MTRENVTGNALSALRASALILATITAACHAHAEPRTLAFAGREWTVRSGSGGPGPNPWSDSPESVWVDEKGLHLKIRQIDGVWHCAEVVSAQPTCHGVHRFRISGQTGSLDKNVVASPFLYRDDVREVDIEFSRWGRERGPDTQYVVQPFQTRGNIHRFTSFPETETTHCIDWQPDSIRFSSFPGHGRKPAGKEAVKWTYKGKDIPREDDGLRIHINLWLVRGMPPSDGKEAEFVVKEADLPPAPREKNGGRTSREECAGRTADNEKTLHQPLCDPVPVADR